MAVDRAPVADLADLVPAPALVAAADLAVVTGFAPGGIAVDMALAASVSALTAASIALVAAVTDCRAVVIVLAEDVACVAAVFSFAAAFVTRVAAEDTVRGAAPGVRPVEVLAALPVPARVLFVGT